MTCEECEERVFELIEREATDPEGVHEVLSQCPDCRTLFDAMKAGLAEAQRLPREAPSSETDAAILRHAEARAVELRPRRRWFPGSQWAVAAAALLAVSIGVWSIPQTPEPPAAPAPPHEDTASAPAEPTGATEPSGATAALGSVERAEAAALQPQRKRAPKVSNVLAEKEEQPSRIAMSDDAAGASADVTFEAASRVAQRQGRAAALSPACRELRQRVDQSMQESDASAASVEPEQALALGRCYRAAGDVPEARRWLEMAASHRETKRRALKELRSLPPP
jgi:hypothetical protein